MSPTRTPIDGLEAGEVGYIITGLKDVSELKVGDTLTTARRTVPPSRCRATSTSSRWCSPACSRPTASSTPTCATRWRSSSSTTPRCTTCPRPARRSASASAVGFLGLLHMEVIRERLEREFDLELIATTPNVEYRVHTVTGEEVSVNNPSQMPDANTIETHRRALREELRDRPEGVRRRRHGAVPGPARRVRPHGVPDADAGRAHLQAAAGRDRARLLRPAEVAHQGLRLVRLRDLRLDRAPTSSRSTSC